ncbi:alpha-2,3-N-acetylneuraminyltransferase [Streptococcus suis]|nr:alpha-2,3-N-acetylneuraminyltransferase [Streptococcus suis]NQO84843.1 alpha-2,3-N-acetylneuraminyltransferase [Streptococcus suis]HEM5490810.1 alpha-2,3-N-acetylneuraminyltransferase [Streptococcus suis]
MIRKKSTDIYICYTLYHLLVSLIYCLLSNNRTKIVITTRILDAKKFGQNIKEVFPKFEVEIVNDEDFTRDGCRYSYRVHELFQSIVGVGNMHIFNESTQIGYYLHRNRIPYTLLEDGLNSLQHPKNKYHYSRKEELKYFLYNKPRHHGYSRFCRTIIVNEIKGIPIDSRQKKLIEDPKDKLLSQLSLPNKEKLLYIFGMTPLKISDPAVIILTQPLEDEFLDDLKKQVFWKSLIDKYISEGYNVYVKVHPRDSLDYSHFPVSILPKNVPAELLDFVIDKQFEIGVTYYSTALEFMNCVKEKIYLNWEK